MREGRAILQSCTVVGHFLLQQVVSSGLPAGGSGGFGGQHGANIFHLQFSRLVSRPVEGRTVGHTDSGGVQRCTPLYSKATTPRKFSARQSAGERSWASLDKTKQQNVSWIFISKSGDKAVK